MIRNQLAENKLLNELVEVVVSDNCSTDNTVQVIKKYKDYFTNFKYSVNESNLGYDLNVLNVVSMATGKYCWYLGDDDVIVNGGVKFIYYHLKDDLHDIVCVESEPATNDKTYKAEVSFSQDPIIEIKDFNEFYFDGYCQGGFSVLIFNRELWMKSVNVNDYLKWWIYYETVLKVLARTKKTMLYVKKPVIVTGQDCRWSENGNELYTFINSNILMKKMVDFGFDKKRLLDLLSQNSKKIIIMLLRAKGHGLKCNTENLKYIYKNSREAGFVRLGLVIVVYFIPNWLIVMARDLKKKLI